MRTITYGIGGYDPTKPNNNVVSDVDDGVPENPSVANQITIRAQAQTALQTNTDALALPDPTAANTTYLAIASPTNAQVTAQVRALTQQNNALVSQVRALTAQNSKLIRLALGLFDATT